MAVYAIGSKFVKALRESGLIPQSCTSFVITARMDEAIEIRTSSLPDMEQLSDEALMALADEATVFDVCPVCGTEERRETK